MSLEVHIHDWLELKDLGNNPMYSEGSKFLPYNLGISFATADRSKSELFTLYKRGDKFVFELTGHVGSEIQSWFGECPEVRRIVFVWYFNRFYLYPTIRNKIDTVASNFKIVFN